MKSIIAAAMLCFSLGVALPAFAEEQSGSLVSVSINNASAEEIAETLSGVGLAKAQAIVSYREENGAFGSLEELQLVKGIGPATIERNRDRIALK